MKKHLLATLLLCFSVSFAAAAKAQKLPKQDPLVDFTQIKVEKGKWIDKTGNAVITPGKNAKVGVGPFGKDAFSFDGTKASTSKMDLTKISAKIDGFEYSISFWFKADEFIDPKANYQSAGNAVGMGMKFNSLEHGSFGIGGVGLHGVGANWFAINPKRWNHIAVMFSQEKRIAKIYVNGLAIVDTNGGKFWPLNQSGYKVLNIGAFKGTVADIQIWDKLIPAEQVLNMTLTPEYVKEIHADIDAIAAKCDNAPGAMMMTGILHKELDALAAKNPVPMLEYDKLLKRLLATEKMIPAVKALRNTKLVNSPFAFMQVRAISPEKRVPTKYPSDPIYSDELNGVAAKGEYASLSFIMYPYNDMKKIEFELNDLKDDKGNVISKDEMELKFVQCWFQPGWNTYFNGHGDYVPSLLLNDPELLRVDERTKTNYVRFFYPGGVQYHNTCIGGSTVTHPPFDWAFEPVWDADTLQPIPCDFGRNRQFWLVIHAPEKIKAGIYRGPIKIKTEGKVTGEVTVVFKVLPFELPMAMAQYNLDVPFDPSLACSMNIDALTAKLKDPKKAREMTWAHMVNQRKHSIVSQPLGISVARPDTLKEMIDMHKKAGLRLTNMFGGAAHTRFREFGDTRPYWTTMEKHMIEAEMKKHIAHVDKVAEMADRFGLDRKYIHFFGKDECQGASALREEFPFRDYIIRNGMSVRTTGWEDNYRNSPSHEVYHTTAAYVHYKNADRWHAMRAQITAYCAPFMGPDNPHLMRYTHGLVPYRHNYDGWWELAYDNAGAHAWNHLFGWDTTYRPFRVVIPTMKGPIINTIAFSGVRAGQDDVRYATLMYQLADECFESGKPECIIAARRAIAWFRGQPMPTGTPGISMSMDVDLYAYRENVTNHIIALMKVLGKPIE